VIFRIALVALALAGLIVGNVVGPLGHGAWSGTIFTAATLPILAALLVDIVQSLRRGQVGLDLVAAVSMSAALGFGESLAGNVVGLMYAGGELLEAFAEGRARREMTALLERVAHTAMRHVDGRLEEVAIGTLEPGDHILVRSGETLPVDGSVVSGSGGTLDESALTGEALPVWRAPGETALSGSTNAGDSFDLLVSRPASESTYARIVRLVEAAQEAKAPATRLADRYALVFLGVTLVIAGLAWALSGDHIRALAVLVVATPCPLILALPVALISGLSRAARSGVLVKNAGALEILSTVRTAILDKTGTLTYGHAEVTEIRPMPGVDPNEVLRLAASLDQASNHVIAEALVKEARRRNLTLTPPHSVIEDAGAGVSGWVGDIPVVAGASRYVMRSVEGDIGLLHDGLDGETALVTVGAAGRLFGLIALNDPVRPDAQRVLEGLRAIGVTRLILASGDRQDVVDAVARDLPLDLARGDLTPEDKLALVAAESEKARTLMIGDGVNDAPALATATLGIAMGARGSAASSESADVVILVDQLGRVLDALRIAHRTRRIALESVVGGLGLSLLGMIAAALGYLPPLSGAVLQEVIDVAVILNALRALR
jgi:heavy metal translocating P-type ATPase